MQIRELKVPDAVEVIPRRFDDERGAFLEWFRADRLEEVTGRRIEWKQGNLSISKRGVLRGVHYADIPPSQAKYVTCVKGAIQDFVIDLRVGSPAFGTWEAVRVDSDRRNGLFLAEGLGHAFLALEDDTVVSYLVSAHFDPDREHGIDPLDEDLGLDFGDLRDELILSDKDRDAPSLRAALDGGMLPEWMAARRFYSAAH